MNLGPNFYFNLAESDHAALFEDQTYVWEALPRIHDYILQRLEADMPRNASTIQVHGSVWIGEDVHIGEGTRIEPGVTIEGPALIGRNCQLRQGAYVRANTILGDGGTIGHATETKNAVMLEGAAAPHFAYVGDSLLGARVNLGAGTKLSNYPMNVTTNPETGQKSTIHLDVAGEHIDTGLVKIGGILGDDVQLGCNCVANPGTLVGPRTLVYALTALRKGVYPPDHIIKLRQTHEIVARKL